MEFYYNLYTHSAGEFKGRVDGEYYAVGEKQVLCIYAAGVETEVHLSYWDSSWKFGKKTSEEEYEKALMKSVFYGQINGKMIEFYLEDK